MMTSTDERYSALAEGLDSRTSVGPLLGDTEGGSIVDVTEDAAMVEGAGGSTVDGGTDVALGAARFSSVPELVHPAVTAIPAAMATRSGMRLTGAG